jgi:hypothetical protein
MQIVPPVMMMSTRESVTPLLMSVAPVGAFDSILFCVYSLVLKSSRVDCVVMLVFEGVLMLLQKTYVMGRSFEVRQRPTS